MEKPIWKDIKYDKNYKINQFGEIWNIRKQIKMKLNKYSAGYYFVTFCSNGIKHSESIHRLLYEHFIGEIPKGYCIDHIDNNKTNNSLDNLRLCTRRENSSFSNRNVTNNTGEHNIWYDKTRKKFRVAFSIKKKKKHFGLYKTLKEAIFVRDKIFNQLLNNEINW